MARGKPIAPRREKTAAINPAPSRAARRARQGDFRAARRRHAGAQDRTRISSTTSRCSSPSCCRRRRPTSASTRRRAALFAIADTPLKMVALGEAGLTRKNQDDRPLSQQGEERHRDVAGADARSWRRGAARPRGARGVARRRAQDRQCRAQRRLRRPTIAVDTHVFRVANRIPLARGKTPREVEDGLMAVMPARFMLDTPITG